MRFEDQTTRDFFSVSFINGFFSKKFSSFQFHISELMADVDV